MPARRILVAGLLLAACSEGADGTPAPASSCERVESGPSDDPADWSVEAGRAFTPHVSAPRFVIPGPGLPVTPFASNNNVAILVAKDRTFLAWRTSPTHFASSATELHVISSETGAAPFTHEATFALGTDVREPAFLLRDGVLSLSFFEAGASATAFEPRAVWRAERCRAGAWSKEAISAGEKVPWDVKQRGGLDLRTAYSGDHYGAGDLSLHLEVSRDAGRSWVPLGKDPVSRGGDSEAAFELDPEGALWAVTRNEDGDATGQGSKICTAPASDPSAFTCDDPSHPDRYDSPEMLRHGDELWLLARRDVGGHFGDDQGLIPYSTRPKRSALYRVDRALRKVVWVMDLPGVGDTAFVSAKRVDTHRWLFANYTSPLDDPDVSWFAAQTSPRGTQIYVADLTFE